MTRNLKSVRQFAETTPFSESQTRWWLFQAEQNGLAKVGAVVRIGRRVYIDVDRFDDWLTAQNPPSQVAA